MSADSLVEFVLQDGNIKVVLEELPTQARYLSLMEQRVIEAGDTPKYIDVIRYMKILELLDREGEKSKREISKLPNITSVFRGEIKKYYQSPLTDLCSFGLIEQVGVSKRYTNYRITEHGRKAISDYELSKGAPVVGTNFNRDGDWLIPAKATR